MEGWASPGWGHLRVFSNVLCSGVGLIWGVAQDSRGGDGFILVSERALAAPHSLPACCRRRLIFGGNSGYQSCPKPAHEQAVLVYDPRPKGTVTAHPYM